MLQRFVLVGIVVSASIGIAQRIRERGLIDRTAANTVGTITRHERSGKSGTVTYYEYVVKGTRYETVSGDDKRFGDCIETGSCIGLRFVVEYSTTNPAISRILWDEHLPNEDCSRARKGRFIDKSGGGTSTILRTATEQREYSSGKGEMRLRLRWLDDCTYQLYERTVITGSEPLFPASPQDTITVRIISLDDEGFSYEARTSSMDMAMTGRQLYDK
ncbi:MAG: hypothetical protein IPL86_12425 [Flavobacteriales bacterium]|nr:hypothetical protein [Flavobacteriales bacterium]